MNYLAHAYLSFAHPEILTGNMISDFVKGKKKYDFSLGIQSGIALHREIDRFTDEHEVIKKIKHLFQPTYRLYSSAIIDVLFDHFLATDQSEFNETKLETFTESTYAILSQFSDIFPEKFELMFPYMKSQNWLYNYQYPWGIEKSLRGLVRRSKYMAESETAYTLFQEHYKQLSEAYQDFFPSVKNMAINYINNLPKTN